MGNRKLILGIILLILLLPEGTSSFEKDTHFYMNEKIAANTIGSFSLNDYLINELGLKDGIYEIIAIGTDKRSIQMWVTDGGSKEDDPEDYRIIFNGGRANNHYHNPLEPLNEAGLNDSVWGIFRYTGQSSILWAQNQNQNVGEKGSWQDARRYFGEGLNAPAKADRDNSMAKVFRSLGQLMHLVQDASVPAHARNNIHIQYNYEKWLVDIQTYEEGNFGKFIQNPFPFNKSILNFAENPLAPIPIAKIIDTDQYDGKNPEVTVSPAIGIAEYTSANFFSERTVFSEKIPFPSRSSVVTADYYIPDPRDEKKTVARQYYRKAYDGDTGYRLATVGLLRNYITKYFTDYTGLEWEALDGGVYRDYAERLLPRAVGYSAGLLEYFFRGQLDIHQGPDGIKIKNLSSEDMEGKFAFFYDAIGGSRKPVKDGVWSLTLAVNESSDPLKFPDPDDINEKGEYMLVFQGRMGKEPGAVVGKKWERTHNWKIVVDYPPKPEDRYRIKYTENPGSWTDCGTVAGEEFIVNVIDKCPNAGGIKIYLMAVNGPTNIPVYKGCEGNLDVIEVGQLKRSEIISKIYYQIEKLEIYWRKILDNPFWNSWCKLNSGKDAFAMDIYEVSKANPEVLFSWEKISLETPEINSIKNVLFPEAEVIFALKANNLAEDYYRDFIPTQDFSYAVTVLLAGWIPLCSQDESTSCYCSDRCNNGYCPDPDGAWCLDVVGYMPKEGPIEKNVDIKIRIPDILEHRLWGKTERLCFNGFGLCEDK